MADYKYLMDRIKEMSVPSMLYTARAVRNRSNKSTAGTVVDMVRCGIKYSAGYTDYYNFAFETKSTAERRNVITRGVNNDYVKALNSVELNDCFNDKRQLYRLYADFISRKWLDLERSNAHQLCAFLGGDNTAVVRASDSKKEKGSFVLNLLGIYDYEDLRERLLRMGLNIVEKCVKQNEEMEWLCGNVLGIIRVVTVGESPVFSCLNMRQGKTLLTAAIDYETGIVMGSAYDKNNGMYHRHPITKKRFDGFHIPLWNEIMTMVTAASRVLTSVNYCGWDIAVLADRPELIDATSFPRHDLYRVCDNKDLRDRIEREMYSGIKNNQKIVLNKK